jgi:anti-sigma B factor antagonist
MRPFSCRSYAAGGAIRVAVTGELDMLTAPRLDRALHRAARRAPAIVLDLRELDFLDSSGGHLIVAARRRVRDAGGRLVVVRGHGFVERFFALVGLDRELELTGDQAAPKEWERLDTEVNAAEERPISATAR